MESLTKKILWGLGTAAFIFFVINRLFFFSYGFLEKLGTGITYPIVRLSSIISTGIKNTCERKASYEHLHQKYIAVKNAYLDALTENIQLKALLHYDQMSKDLRDFQERYQLPHMTLAKILVKNITDDEHYFLVNKGINDGISKDMIALYKFQLIGKVSEVYSNYSKVLLITDQMCKVAAFAHQTKAQGIVHGQNIINRCSMNYVSHLFKVVDHDLVLSSGQGLVFPEGFCLGKIVSHELKEKSLYHEIELEPLVNLQALEFCMLSNNAKMPILLNQPSNH
jgi:rod shape-determining protein MreC